MTLLRDPSQRRFLTLALMLAAMLAAPGALEAQETTASIRGLIIDASGTPVPNAKVEVLDHTQLCQINDTRQRCNVIRVVVFNPALGICNKFCVCARH